MAARRRRDRYRHGGPWANSHGRVRRYLTIPIIVVLALLAVVLVAWGVDSKLHSDDVARGVKIDERNISGESPTQLDAELLSVAQSWAAVPVHVTTPKGVLDTDLGQLGVGVDQVSARRAALAVSSDDFVLFRPFLWVKSWISPRTIPLTFAADPAAATAKLADITAQNTTPPTEPTFTVAPDKVSVVASPAQNGQTIDPIDIVKQVIDQANAGRRTISVDVKPVVQPPKFNDADAAKLVDQANQMTKKSVSIYLNDKSIKVDTKTLLSWLKLGPAAAGGIDIQIDEAKVAAEVPKLLGVTGLPVTQTSFFVGFDGQVHIADGKAGSKCCTPESIQLIPDALKTGKPRVDLQMVVAPPDHDHAWAESMKITTKVADFTTPHPCCEPRVTNIHHIADAVRGAVIPPGETFSVNGYVGQRTKEKGYVEAPVIYDATHDTDVGGGVSQFATTTFNAAFFAGLDIPAYQMHSLYISRYPYGREATISWEQPDLKIKNNTPFGVMLWPTYNDTSLTVSVFSTPWVKGDQTNQTKEQKGPCTRVTTERTRTFFLDGRTETDKFTGLYQPADGVKC